MHTPYQASALLFDLDDTLYDRQGTFTRWANAFVQTRFPQESHTLQQEAMDFLIALDGHGQTPRKELFAMFQQRYPNLCTVESIIEMYYRQFPAYMEYGHLLPLLQPLQHAHVPFGIVTNGFARQQLPKIAALGLASLTSCVFISEIFGAEKPDASIFLAAAACLGAPAHQIFFIGDNPLVDIYGAHQVGMRTVWIRNGATWPMSVPFCADITVDSLAELPRWATTASEVRLGESL